MISVSHPKPFVPSEVEGLATEECLDPSTSLRKACARHEPRDDNGFTLVELMVVIVIIGLLTTVVALTVLPRLGQASAQKAKTDIEMLDQAVQTYRIDNVTYPTTAQGLAVLVAPRTGAGAGGGYIKKLPDDPWKRPYVYAMPGQHGAFDISSLGADGAPGGTGENADIGNWQ